MTKLLEREKAILLRKEGKSYREILKELRVSKSSLSLWLRPYPLSPKQIKRFKDLKDVQIERYIQTMRAKRIARLDSYYQEQKGKWLPLTKRELFLTGLFLYWGEGNKASRDNISLNNTDPAVVKFGLFWMTNALDLPKEKIKINLHLYDDMNKEKEIKYWSNTLNMPIQQFYKPYIKKSKRIGITQKGFGHGTCGVRISHTPTKERILMAIRAFSDNFDII